MKISFIIFLSAIAFWQISCTGGQERSGENNSAEKEAVTTGVTVTQLLGMTIGDEGDGNLIKINKDGTGARIAHVFSPLSNPEGCLVPADNGRLYGLTSGTIPLNEDGSSNKDGSFTAGVIFSFDPSDNTYTELFRFDSKEATGIGPFIFIRAGNGKLYGTTIMGGRNNDGIIFSFDPANNSFTKLFDFKDRPSGSNPVGGLTIAKDGKIFGTATLGGQNNEGVLFRFDPSDNSYTKLLDFDTVKNYRLDRVIQGEGGKLFGIGRGRATGGKDILSSFDITGNTYHKLFDFNNTDGYNPVALLQANDKKLYGTTRSGGNNNKGVIFSFGTASNSYSKLYDFSNTQSLVSPLIQAADGKLYGMIKNDSIRITNSDSDVHSYGIVFNFDPVKNTYTQLYKLDGTGVIGTSVNTGFAEMDYQEINVDTALKQEIKEAQIQLTLPNEHWHFVGKEKVKGKNDSTIYSYMRDPVILPLLNDHEELVTLTMYITTEPVLENNVISYASRKRIDRTFEDKPMHEVFTKKEGTLRLENAIGYHGTYNATGMTFYEAFIINNKRGVEIYVDIPSDLFEKYKNEFPALLRSIEKLQE